MSNLSERLKDPSLADPNESCPLLVDLIRESTCDTWFQIVGLSDAVKYFKGTSVGRPCADILFNLAMAGSM